MDGGKRNEVGTPTGEREMGSCNGRLSHRTPSQLGVLFAAGHLARQTLGSPDDSDIGFLENENARRYLRTMPKVPKRPLGERFPSISPLAMDLMEKMLLFDPAKRISGVWGGG